MKDFEIFKGIIANWLIDTKVVDPNVTYTMPLDSEFQELYGKLGDAIDIQPKRIWTKVGDREYELTIE